VLCCQGSLGSVFIWIEQEWHRLNITVINSSISASVDGKVVYSGQAASGGPTAGMVVLQSTYQYTYFDNFVLE
jgi:hypothetical protein